MALTVTKGSFTSDRYWTYNLSFNWAGNEGEDIRVDIEFYHTQEKLITKYGAGVYIEGEGYLYGIKWTTAIPYYKFTIRYRTSVTREEIITIDPPPNHISDSYIKPVRPPVHYQYAVYNNAYYMYEANSCVSNSLCAGIDGCYRSAYDEALRPSVGYLYGSVEQDKPDSFGMLFESPLNYLISGKGIANASILKSNADQTNLRRSYPHNLLKQQRTIPTHDGGTMVADGSVQVYNNNKDNAQVKESEKYARLSSWQLKNIAEEIIDMMEATRQDNKFVMLCLGICTEFDYASDNGGICGRLMANTTARGGHACLVVGWKKIGDEYYWILQNSWGEEKGDNGLMYVPVSWFWKERSGGNVGLWYGYVCTYSNVGQNRLKAPNPPRLDTTLGKDGRGNKTLYLICDEVTDVYDGIDTYTVKYVDESNNESTRTSFFNNIQIYPPKYGETYRLSLMYESKFGVKSKYSTENIATTLPKEPTISLNKSYSNSVVLNVNVTEGKWTDVAVHMYEGSAYIKTLIVPKGTTTCTFSGLKSGVSYKFDAETRYTIRGTTLISYKKSNSITVTTGADIKKFYWTTSIATGNSIANNTGSDNKWYSYPITATEWNDYIATLKKTREIKQVSTSRTFSTASRGTRMVNLINQAIDGLNDMLSTGKMNRISSDSKLTASIFLDLQNKLNNVIDTII